MLKIGVTGSFGSGKSTVAKMLSKISSGCLIDADKIAGKLVSGGLKREIAKEFGTNNRKALAAIVFSDKNRLKRLNAIVHPFVNKEINRIVKECKKDFAIIDAPLLIEAGISTDKIIVVKAGIVIQAKRLGKRFSKADVLKRINAQMAISEKIKHADYVVYNNGTLKSTENQVKAIWNEVKGACIQHKT